MMNRVGGVQAVKPEGAFTGQLKLYLLFQEGQKATQSHCIPQVGLSHPLNLHLQATATTQHHGLSLDFMNERMNPEVRPLNLYCRPLVLRNFRD